MQNRDTVDACEAMLMRISQYWRWFVHYNYISDSLYCNSVSPFSNFAMVCWLLIGFCHAQKYRNIISEGLQNLGLCWRFFIVPQLIWHGASFFPVSSEGKPNSFLSYDKQGILRTYSYPYPNEFFSQRCNRSDLSWPYIIVYRTHNLPYTRRTTWFVNHWLLHVSKVLFIFTGPLASALCNRFTCRTVVMAGGVLLCVGVLVSGFAPSLEFLYFSYSLIGGKKIDQILLWKH